MVLGSVALAALARYALNPVFGHRVSFITFIPALAFSAWRGGWASGMGAVTASILAALLLVSPQHVTGIALSLSDQVTLGIFVVDGLTEAGPSRTALLTGDGVALLLAETAGREVNAPKSAEAVVQFMMASVDAYAEAGIRDDQCLLVAVAG